jgi:hypothetical protein
VTRSPTTYHDWLFGSIFADLIDGCRDEMAILKFFVFSQTETIPADLHMNTPRAERIILDKKPLFGRAIPTTRVLFAWQKSGCFAHYKTKSADTTLTISSMSRHQSRRAGEVWSCLVESAIPDCFAARLSEAQEESHSRAELGVKLG